MGTSAEDWETLQRNIDNTLAFAGSPIPKPVERVVVEPEPTATDLVIRKIDSDLSAVANLALANF